MSPLQTLYSDYVESTEPCYKYAHAFDELYKHTEIRTLLDEFVDGVCENDKKAFCAGFKTAVQLLMGGGQA